jgi:RNase adapter protein RapZ
MAHDEQAETGLGSGVSEVSAAQDAKPPRVVIITGMSGSGKSTAMRALEDAGFFCIDNMPVPLLPKVLDLASGRAGGRAPQPYAFVVDTREREFLSEAGEVIDQLVSEGVQVQIIFLEADDDTLVRRYSETRRRHPMSDLGTVRDGIARERKMLEPLRERASTILDTTRHNVHSLKELLQGHMAGDAAPSLQITVLSFGFKYGLPPECDLVFDVRFLPNPYFVEGLREKTGLDEEVSAYVLSLPDAVRLLDHLQQMWEFMLPLYDREGKSYLTLAIGCTGGRHRSVALAQVISARLRAAGWTTEVRHRDVGRS